MAYDTPIQLTPRIIATVDTPGTRTNAITMQGCYAYVSDFGSGPGTFGINVYDISDPANPVLVRRFNQSTPPAVNNTYRLVASGQYLYVAVNSRLMIYDISDPANPVRVALIGAGGQAFDVDVQGDILTLANTGANTRVYSVTNPASPQFLGAASGATAFVCQRGRFVYSTAYAAQDLVAIDLQDPFNPVVVGTINLGTATATLPLDVEGQCGRAYVAIEGSDPQIAIVDINDPTNMVELGRFGHSLGGNTNDICAMGRYIAVGDSLSSGQGIVTFYDVTDPQNVTVAATIDVGQSAESLRAYGSLLYVTDRLAGTFVVIQLRELQQSQAGYFQTLGAGQLDVQGSAAVGDALRVGSSINVGQHVYAGERISARRSIGVAEPLVLASLSDPGRPGSFGWDEDYFYWRASTEWKRVAAGATSGSDPHWYPWNNQNDTGITGVGNGAAAANIMSLTDGGFRLFGENISDVTEIEVIPTSAASGTSSGAVTTGGGVFPSFSTVYTPPSGSTPGYITVTVDSPAPAGTYWIRGRNPGGNWVPAPIIVSPGAG